MKRLFVVNHGDDANFGATAEPLEHSFEAALAGVQVEAPVAPVRRDRQLVTVRLKGRAECLPEAGFPALRVAVERVDVAHAAGHGRAEQLVHALARLLGVLHSHPDSADSRPVRPSSLRSIARPPGPDAPSC